MRSERPHRKLEVWKKAMELAQDVYALTDGFPPDEKFGLISQMRRAVVSIPSNIAEGAARKGVKEFRQFLNIAQGSASELDTQLELAALLKLVKHDDLARVAGNLEVVSKMLSGLDRSLKPATPGAAIPRRK